MIGVADVLALAVGLGMDAMSVSAAVGVKWHGPKQTFRLAWHMGLFQFLMPIIGWWGGQSLAEVLKQVGSYIAAVLVFAIGAKMLYEALRRQPGQVGEKLEQTAEKAVGPRSRQRERDPTRGWSVLALSVATSLDALVVGFSLGIKGAGSIWLASVVIGVVAAAMSLTGVLVGKKVGQAIRPIAEAVGAVVLMGLAVSFLFV